MRENVDENLHFLKKKKFKKLFARNLEKLLQEYSLSLSLVCKATFIAHVRKCDITLEILIDEFNMYFEIYINIRTNTMKIKLK